MGHKHKLDEGTSPTKDVQKKAKTGGDKGGVFAGCSIVVSGQMSMIRKQFLELLVEHGAVIGNAVILTTALTQIPSVNLNCRTSTVTATL